jgi:dihydrofolate reductase
VIGGGQVYAQALAHPLCEAVHLTLVHATVPGCDTFFPRLDPDAFRVWSAAEPIRDRDSGLSYSLLCYTRARHGPSSDPWQHPGVLAPSQLVMQLEA